MFACCEQPSVQQDLPGAPKGAELLYFPVTALGEPLRLTMAIGSMDFKDTTPANDEDFAKKKAELSPYGALPVLVLEGKPMPQARAILRYLGKVLQYEGKPLYPADALEAYHCDELIELVEDVRAPLAGTFAIKDQAEKEKARGALFAEDGKMTQWLAKLDKRLESFGPSVHIGDIYAFCIVNMLRQPTFIDGIPKDSLDKYSNLTKHHEFVAKLPPVLGYYKDKDGHRASFKPFS
mmetsp:Transcript_2271/g.7289  ORF Transcript_2271/g.7289 Transcript_2271/m.7289 type:complete len:236 (-) Transcript_2271:50-757(-)